MGLQLGRCQDTTTQCMNNMNCTVSPGISRQAAVLCGSCTDELWQLCKLSIIRRFLCSRLVYSMKCPAGELCRGSVERLPQIRSMHQLQDARIRFFGVAIVCCVLRAALLLVNHRQRVVHVMFAFFP